MQNIALREVLEIELTIPNLQGVTPNTFILKISDSTGTVLTREPVPFGSS